MPELHICSLLLHVRPEQVDDACRQVLALGGEVHAADERGKVIVTLETGHEGHIGSALTELQLLPGVLAATLIFHQVEHTETEPGDAPATEEPPCA